MPWPETDVLEPGSEPVDALTLLRADFAEVDGVFARYWDVSHDDDPGKRATKIEVAREVCHRTRVHLGLEEAFVRAVTSVIADEALLHEMRASQAKALHLVMHLENVDPFDRQYDPAVRVLGDFLLQRVEGEREGVFRHVAASRLNLFDLGEQLRGHRARLMAQD